MVTKQPWELGNIYQQPKLQIIKKYNTLSKDKYLNLFGLDKNGYLWLTPENNFSDYVIVLSNVVWNTY